jgi:hypothetical protein
VAIGTNVQAYDADLTTYAGITPSANVQTLLGSANYSAFRSSLGLGGLATQSGPTGSTQCAHFDSSGNISGTGSDCGAGSGTVTTTGSPASGNLTKFSGGSSVTSGDLSGDVTTSGTLATTIGSNKVTNGMIRQSGALAVVGRSANSTGNVADIQATAASDGVLRESGSTIGFGTIATGGIANSAVTLAKIANASAIPTAGRRRVRIRRGLCRDHAGHQPVDVRHDAQRHGRRRIFQALHHLPALRWTSRHRRTSAASTPATATRS